MRALTTSAIHLQDGPSEFATSGPGKASSFLVQSMKRFFVFLVAGAACLTVRVADAAIGVNSQQTFNVAPPVANWSTRTIAGGSGAPNDAATLDAAVQTNTASLFTTALAAAAGNPPAA